MIRVLTSVLALFLLLAGISANAAEEQEDRLKELEAKVEQLQKQLDAVSKTSDGIELEEIRRQLRVLSEEIEKLRSGEEEQPALEESERRALGLGPSAATVYRKKQGVSIAGYGEMLYENFAEETDSETPSGRTDQIDFLRAIVYFGYRFNENFLFNSEIEFEHASTGEGGEVSVEFAHLDYIATEGVTLRGGMVLLPMGLVNEIHEPTAFLGARRPVTETVIIPSTWRENGFGIVGRRGMFDYRAYLINGFNAAGFSSSGLRDGRQDGARARLKNPSFAGRVDVTPTAGLLVGGSLYAGNSGVFDIAVPTELEVRTVIGELHGDLQYRALALRALFAQATLDDVAQLNQALALEGPSTVGERLRGGYLQAGYNLLAGHTGRKDSLTPYVRFESVNTHSEVPAGFAKNPARDQTIWTFGVEYKPILNIVIKADYQAMDNAAGTAVDQLNITLGYNF